MDTRESMNLEAFQIIGKNALVTGSHRGLGSAIAVFLFVLVVPVLLLNVSRFRREN